MFNVITLGVYYTITEEMREGIRLLPQLYEKISAMEYGEVEEIIIGNKEKIFKFKINNESEFRLNNLSFPEYRNSFTWDEETGRLVPYHPEDIRFGDPENHKFFKEQPINNALRTKTQA